MMMNASDVLFLFPQKKKYQKENSRRCQLALKFLLLQCPANRNLPRPHNI
ncbi:hypothetical protein [Mucilaginibacter terrenus]|nr:hypothetical protein [Mucilaginibacter terrenus]